MTGKIYGKITGKMVIEPISILEDKIKVSDDLFFQERGGLSLFVEPHQFKWGILNNDNRNKLRILEQELTIAELMMKGFTEELIFSFYDAGLITINNKPKYNINFCEENRNKELSIVVLHTTNSCNFRCAYCYVNASIGISISPEVTKKVVDRILNHKTNGAITIEFHGGEPLLKFDLIKSTVEYAKREDKNDRLRFSIQTNASLLDDKIASFLVKNKFSIGTSLDGLNDTNDKNRKYKNGAGTYNDIMRGIKTLRQYGEDPGVIMVITDLKQVDEVYNFMIKSDINSIKLNPYFNQGRGAKQNELQYQQKELAEKTINLFYKIIEHNKNNSNKLHIANASILLNNLLGKQDYMCMRTPCGAGTTMLGVDIDGSVYPCEEMTGKKELIAGNIRDKSIQEILDNKMIHLIKSRSGNNIEDCVNCYARNACGINCANVSYNENRNFNAKSDSCEYYKTMILELMWMFYKDREGIQNLL